MKYTQNEKILQVTDETLVIGVDVASEVHYARAFDFRGIELGSVFRVPNDAEGFHNLTLWINELKVKHGKKMLWLEWNLPDTIGLT